MFFPFVYVLPCDFYVQVILPISPSFSSVSHDLRLQGLGIL